MSRSSSTLANETILTDAVCNFDKRDIGAVISDTTLSFDYKMINTGADSLHVLFISPDCNCTGYRLSKSDVGIGDSISLKLYIDMRNKHKGKFMLNTVVGLNTRQKLYRIVIEGNVK